MGFNDFLNESDKETLKEALGFLNKIGIETAHKGEIDVKEQERILNEQEINEDIKAKLKILIGINYQARKKHLKSLRTKLNGLENK